MLTSGKTNTICVFTGSALWIPDFSWHFQFPVRVFAVLARSFAPWLKTAHFLSVSYASRVLRCDLLRSLQVKSEEFQSLDPVCKKLLCGVDAV